MGYNKTINYYWSTKLAQLINFSLYFLKFLITIITKFYPIIMFWAS